MNNPFTFLITIIGIMSSCQQPEPILKIGLVADPQYAHQENAGTRHYKASLWKLEEAIDTFNYYQVDLVQNLGDIIDARWESFDSILPLYNNLSPDIENHHLLGNHDFAVDSVHLINLLEILSMPDYYYSYSSNGWRFIVLDGTDYSYYSNVLHKHDVSQVDFYYDKNRENSNNYRWNSAIGEKQQNWLTQQLDSASLLNQNVILFSHLPLRPIDNPHNLWNNDEILNLIEHAPNVVAYINGHNHSGGYVFKNGIHYITLVGMVENMTSSYGILEFYRDSLILRGYGDQETITLEIE